MDELIKILLENFQHIGIGVALFVISYISNMAFSIYYNVKLLNEQFELSKIIDSVVKILAIGVGTTLLCIGITCVPMFADYVGFTISEEYQEVFQDLAIISVFIVSSCKYLIEAYTKFKAIFSYSKEN